MLRSPPRSTVIAYTTLFRSTANVAGTYRWTASYSGDANNNSTATACNDANESVVVTKKTPTLTTTASASVSAGGQISDVGHLTKSEERRGGKECRSRWSPDH